MLRKIFFWDNKGGVNNLSNSYYDVTYKVLRKFLFAFFFFGGVNLVSGQGTPISVDCGFIIELEPVILDPISPSTCSTCCIQPSCTQALYKVKLKINTVGLPSGAYNNGDFNLFYKQLSITVQALVADGGLTKINKIETENCGSPFDILVNEVNNSASLDLSTAYVEDPGDLPVITFTDYETDVLFTLVVDFFPGEETGAQPTDFLYVDINNDVCDTYSTAYNGGGSPANYPSPSSVNTAFRIVLASSICTAELASFPVTMPTAGGAVDLLDFGITIETSTPLAQKPAIQVASGQPTPIVEYNKLPNDEGYAMRFTYENVTVNGGGELFRILSEPKLFSGGYTFDASLEVGRVIVSSGACNKPGIGNATAQCSEPGLDACSDFELLVETQSAGFGSTCSELKVYASISGPEDVFDEMHLRFDFIMDAGVSIVVAQVDNMTCPSGCAVTITAPNIVELTSTVPITWGVNSYLYIEFDAPDGCIQDVLVRNAEIKPDGETDFCYPTVETGTFPYCTAEIAGHIATETKCYVPGVNLLIFPDEDPDDCDETILTGCGPYSKCVCAGYDAWSVTPTKDDDNNTDWKNGVSVLDLKIISKHVIGISVLASPYYMIAADVDKSNTVTTFDALEIRKLLLGYYDVSISSPSGGAVPWPSTNARSWQFVPKSFTFPNPSNAFQTSYPTSLSGLPLPTTDADFVAIKSGHVVNEDGEGLDDPGNLIVNEPVTGCDCNAPRPATVPRFNLAAPKVELNSGEYQVLPIYAQADAPLTAWQIGIRFDQQALEFVGVSQGDLPGLKKDNFGLTKVSQGEIRALWMANLGDEDDVVRPGQVLFYLTFRAKTDIEDISKLLRTDDDILPGLGFAKENAAYRFEFTPRRGLEIRDDLVDASDFKVQCRPNPSSEDFTFDVDMPQASKVRLIVYDAFGRRMLFRELLLEAGEQSLPIPEASLWPAGVYRWDIRAGKTLRSKGHAVKL